eukprot:3458620-Lingulodinium_polyedra.AAC.1
MTKHIHDATRERRFAENGCLARGISYNSNVQPTRAQTFDNTNAPLFAFTYSPCARPLPHAPRARLNINARGALRVLRRSRRRAQYH